MSDSEKRTVEIGGVANARDLGGLPAGDGAVKRGLVYRSATLAFVSDGAVPSLAALGIDTVYDLRTAEEVSAAPDKLPAATRHVSLDVLADSSTSVAATLGDFSSDPKAFAAGLAGGRAERLFENSYRDFVRLPSALRAYRMFYLGLVDSTRQGAALFHCTTGKDRTGWAAASLLTLLGVSQEDVERDYLQTNTDLLPSLESVFRRAESQGVERAALLPVLGVRESYLDAAFQQVREQFGDIDGYATRGLGLTAHDLRLLRERFLER